MDYINDREKIIALIRKNLNDDKYSHSLMVEKTALRYAKIYGEDENKAGMAALLHDVVKCFDNVSLAKKYGFLNYTSVKVLHAYLGAIYIEKEDICRDKDIINAVKYHTTGRAEMSVLEKIIYLADATEPLRDYEGVDKLRNLCEENLDSAMAHSLRETLKLLVNKNLPIDENTVMAYNYYNKYLK